MGVLACVGGAGTCFCERAGICLRVLSSLCKCAPANVRIRARLHARACACTCVQCARPTHPRGVHLGVWAPRTRHEHFEEKHLARFNTGNLAYNCSSIGRVILKTKQGRPEDEKERAVHDATAEVVLSDWQEDGESTVCVLSLRPDAAPALRPEMKMLEELALQRDQVGAPHGPHRTVKDKFRFTMSNFFRRRLKKP